MKILMLTWEFPPVVTGGLGMACYGIAKSLLKKVDGIDLIVPAGERVYFPLRTEEDADKLPYRFAPPSTPGPEKTGGGNAATEEIISLLGKKFGAYGAPAETGRIVRKTKTAYSAVSCSSISDLLPDNQDGLIQEVRAYTELAVSIARGLDFDIIHAHDWLTLPAGMLIKEFSGKPLAAHIHSTEFDRVGGAGNEHIHRVEYTGIHKADRVITVSAYTARLIEESYLFPGDRISIVHNAYALKHKTGQRRRIFKEPTILFMGRITVQKGPDYFLEVAGKILRKEPNVRFIMAGKGDLENYIINKSADLEMGTRFLFSGFLNREEVEEIFSASDIFVLPSISEPFGIVCLEAMSYGAVPVISKKSGVCEIITNAYKVDFWDTDRVVEIILDLVRNPEKLAGLSEKCLEEVENMQWDEAAGKIAGIYGQLLRK